MRFTDPALFSVHKKLASGDRLDFQDGMTLYYSSDFRGSRVYHQGKGKMGGFPGNPRHFL
jgi:hypothetical protein